MGASMQLERRNPILSIAQRTDDEPKRKRRDLKLRGSGRDAAERADLILLK